jgi:hypothetical protein
MGFFLRWGKCVLLLWVDFLVVKCIKTQKNSLQFANTCTHYTNLIDVAHSLLSTMRAAHNVLSIMRAARIMSLIYDLYKNILIDLAGASFKTEPTETAALCLDTLKHRVLGPAN